jgi:hypothetical protein
MTISIMTLSIKKLDIMTLSSLTLSKITGLGLHVIHKLMCLSVAATTTLVYYLRARLGLTLENTLLALSFTRK